jgi:hypothetical protein
MLHIRLNDYGSIPFPLMISPAVTGVIISDSGCRLKSFSTPRPQRGTMAVWLMLLEPNAPIFHASCMFHGHYFIFQF